MAYDVTARLGSRFEVRAVHVGDRIDIKGIDPRLTQHLPVTIEVGSTGLAVLVRAGAVVLFNVDPIAQERFIADLGNRVQGRTTAQESERVVVRVGDADAIEPDAIVLTRSFCFHGRRPGEFFICNALGSMLVNAPAMSVS